MPAVHRITNEELESIEAFCQRSPRLSEEVPVTLPCGFRVDEYYVECSRCRNDIPMNSSWVQRQRIELGLKTVETWEVKGICANCKTVTGTFARFRSDGTFDTLVGREWRVGRIGHKPSGSVARLKREVRRWLGL